MQRFTGERENGRVSILNNEQTGSSDGMKYLDNEAYKW